MTDEQIQTLLEVVGEAGYLDAVKEKLRLTDPDLADAVQRILASPSSQSAQTPSAGKTVETWDGLWAAWSNCIAEVGEEEGPYVNHEEHWHPPYFDQSALEDDLENAATRLGEWIDSAFALVKEPELFLDSLTDLNRNMRSFPEWFQPVDDNFCLGPEATACVLRWAWLGLADQPETGRKLVDLICGLEIPGIHTELDRDACCRFLTGLPEPACREIHAYLREPRFEEKVASLRSVWHRIQHEFESRFDPAAHLRACEAHLQEDWKYGEPLIAAAVARQDYAAAEKFLQQTFCRLLGWEGDEPWLPELTLVPLSRYHRSTTESEAVGSLLKQWKEIASLRGKPGRVASLEFQQVVLASPEDWSAVLQAFEDYQRQLPKPAAAEPLFIEWQQRMADTCAPSESGSKPGTDTWAHRLIEAQRGPASKQETFLDEVEVWLNCCLEHNAFFGKHWRSLALLSRHLPQHTQMKAVCPTFHSHVLVPALQISADLEKSLRQALGMFGEKVDRIRVRPVWERHLNTLVPTPGGSGSYYRESALWMKALSEVDIVGYEHVLARWKSEFRRRRNLWQDMAAVGCPGKYG